MTEPQGPDGAPKRLAYGWHCLDCYHDIGVRTSNAIEMLHDIVKDGKSRKVIRKGKRYRRLQTVPIGFKSVVMKTEVPQCECKDCGKTFEVSPPLPAHMCAIPAG